MSKRGDFKKNMELKKLLVILVFILFFKDLQANQIIPSEKLSPYDVVKIQLNALKKIMKKTMVLN